MAKLYSRVLYLILNLSWDESDNNNYSRVLYLITLNLSWDESENNNFVISAQERIDYLRERIYCIYMIRNAKLDQFHEADIKIYS